MSFKITGYVLGRHRDMETHTDDHLLIQRLCSLLQGLSVCMEKITHVDEISYKLSWLSGHDACISVLI
jgi:hypothetical protein